jgi:hypothetical protein
MNVSRDRPAAANIAPVPIPHRAKRDPQTWQRWGRGPTPIAVSVIAPADYFDTPRQRCFPNLFTVLVYLGLATFGANLGWLAAVSSNLGQFEIWLAMAAGSAIALALSAFIHGRVQVLAKSTPWVIATAAATSGLWSAAAFFS